MQLLERRSHFAGRSDERGASMVLVASALMLVFGVAALAIDIGSARTEGVRLQNAADAAALAGAFELPQDAPGARDVAADYAYLGVDVTAPLATACGTDTECFDFGSYTLRVTTPYSDPTLSVDADEAIRVQMCSGSPTFFARLFNTTELSVCGDAIAVADATAPCVLCILGPTGTSLNSVGNGSLGVSGGDVVINSDDADALNLSGSGDITSDGDIGINGGYSAPTGSVSPEPTHADPVPDPLAHLPVPSVSGPPAPKVQISGSSDVTLPPGVYSEIKSTSKGQVTLQPGVYVVTEGISLSKNPAPGKYSFYAPGVIIYFACENYPTPCADGESGADFSSSGGTSLYWTPPTSGPYEGVSVFYDRENTADFSVTGNTDSVFSGSIYMKSGELSLSGTADMSMDSLVVVDSLSKVGTSDFAINYSEAHTPPGFGGPGGNRRLVG